MIDPSTFESANSRLQDLYHILKDGGFDVYMPDVKEGDCLSPYLVIKNDGGTKHSNYSTNIDLYSVMCYVPRRSYSQLEPLMVRVRNYMKENARPLFDETGEVSPSYFDQDLNAHMISIEYRNYKKI